MLENQPVNIFNSKEYKRSRKAYVAQCTFEYFVSLLVADAFLAKLLSSIGIDDALVGIISSFISLAFVVQIMSIFLVRAKISRKRLVICFDTVSQLFFCLIYFLPFLNVTTELKTVFVMLAILIAYICKYLISAICFQWANSYVEPTKRAVYSAKKEIVSLATGIVFSAVIGYIIDQYESIGNLNGGFLFIAISMLVLNVCNFVSLLMIKEDEVEAINHASFSEVIKNTLGNKNFRHLLVMTILWECARYFSIGFIGIYKTKDLMLSVFAVQMINISANVVRMMVSKAFGRYSDKRSFAKGFELAMMFACAAFFVNIFTVPQTKYFIIIYTVLYYVSLAGTNMNSFNITYSYVDAKYTTQAMAIKYSIGGIFGFAASLLGGQILSTVQNHQNMVFGIQVYGQQILAAVSFGLTVITIVYAKVVIEKQTVKIQ